jgi:hypothetical protein
MAEKIQEGGGKEIVKERDKFRLVITEDPLIPMLVRVVIEKKGEVEQSMVPKLIINLTINNHH